METFVNVIQPEFQAVFRKDHPFKGHWKEKVFGNNNPLVLELGCGKGEYTVGLARMNPGKNFLGIDIKGARIWRGAKTAMTENIANVRFLRTRIEFIDSFFAPGEVDEIWITFPDPQPEKKRKRLTSPVFLSRYSRFIVNGGIVHLKTDSRFLYQYTLDTLHHNKMEILTSTDSLYDTISEDPACSIQTYYEKQFMDQGIPITYIRFRLSNERPIEESPAY